MIFYWLFCLSIYMLICLTSIFTKEKAKRLELTRINNPSFIGWIICEVIIITWSIVPVWNIIILWGCISTIKEVNGYSREEFLEEFKNWGVK